GLGSSLQRQGRTQIAHRLLNSCTCALPVQAPQFVSRRFSMGAGFLRRDSCLCSNTAVVGPLEGDLAHQGQHLFGSVPLHLLRMATPSQALAGCSLLWGWLTQDALHPPTTDLKDGFQHLLLQSLEIS